MNILYIGPYKTENFLGYYSLNLLSNIAKTNHNIYTRPIFLLPVDSTNKNSGSDYEVSANDNTYDCVIQHCYIEDMVYTSKIPKHIFCPIIGSLLLNNSQAQKYKTLAQKGKILLSNKKSQYVINSIQLDNTHYLQTEFLLKPDNEISLKLNYGIYNQYKKIYTFIEKHTEERVIKNLIVNFIRSSNKDCCLVLFFININQKILDYYNEFIKAVYANLSVNYSINKIIIVPISHKLDVIFASHKSGDIYLNLFLDDINIQIAEYLNKDIVEYNNINFETSYIDYNSKIYKTGFVDMKNIDFHSTKKASVISNIENIINE